MITNAISEKWRGRLMWGLDIALAAAISGAALYDIWLGEIGAPEDGVLGPRVPNTITFVSIGVALAVRRKVPVATLLVVVAAVLIQTEVFDPPSDRRPFQGFLALLLAFYSVSAYGKLRHAAIGGAVAGAAIIAADLPYLIADNPRMDTFPSWIFIGTVWFVGWAFHRRRTQAVRFQNRAARLEVERGEKARMAVAEERSRIARELHDVIAHSVSVMVIQSQAAQRLIEGDAEREARHALDSIESTGRQALTEMRRLLGILRRTDAELALAPQPTLEHLDALAEHFREAGLPVELEIEGVPETLPPGVDLSAYRIAQEALTNSLKHAGPAAHARVTIRYRKDGVEIEVSDDGAGTTRGEGAGHGLIGMRERAALYDGVFESGKLEGGGYFVRARLPLGRLAEEPVAKERTS